MQIIQRKEDKGRQKENLNQTEEENIRLWESALEVFIELFHVSCVKPQRDAGKSMQADISLLLYLQLMPLPPPTFLFHITQPW